MTARVFFSKAAMRGTKPRNANPKMCKHDFQFASYTGGGARKRKVWNAALNIHIEAKPLTLGFRCRKCGEQVERPATAGERKFHKEYVHYGPLSTKRHIHTVWHEFAKKFKDGFRYQLKGIALIDAVEKWAKKWPDDVRFAGVDDNHFASSDLWFIEHQADDDYMGTTVVYIPQCSGEEPIDFFMYPGHLNGIMAVLKAIKKGAGPRQRRHRQREALVARLTKKNLRHPPVLK